MPIFILTDATGIGSNALNSSGASVDLAIIANDSGIGSNDPVGGRALVTYMRTLGGAPQLRLDTLINTPFSPDYGSGAAQVDIVIVAGLSGFTLDDGTSFANNGTALPPSGSGLPGAGLNTTTNCLVIYDTQQTICVARDGTGGDIDLPISNPVVLYHELSHAFRILSNSLLGLTAECNPSSPEERAAIIDENDLRTDIANRTGAAPELRDPGIHCGEVHEDCSSCCIIATVASKSMSSAQVRSLRCVRDHFVRSTEVGHAFFAQFFHDYYSFSPQVCTIMARYPGISGHLLDGYINPLLDFWKLMIERSREQLSDEAVGVAFVRLHSDLTLAQLRLEALHRTELYWFDHEANDDRVPMELIDLLRERAWPSDYIQWALVAPVGIYQDLLVLYLDDASVDVIGHAFNQAIDAWAPEAPLSAVWASLPAEELKDELEFCDTRLLQTFASKKRFRQRLKERFPDITAIDVVVNLMSETTTGGAR